MAVLGSVDIPFTNAKLTATNAQTTATSASNTASAAQTTATGAATAAATAQQAANDAKSAAEAAQMAADNAMATADGNIYYVQQNAPVSPKAGQMWYQTNSSGVVIAIKDYDGSQWTTRVDQAGINSAVNQASADSESALSQAQSAVDTANAASSTASSAAQDASIAINTANSASTVANAASQTASDAAIQASTAASNAQTAMSNASSALSTANAANANANTREPSIIKSATEPTSPAADQLWVDTSTTPQLMKRWSGSAWITLSPTQASQIGAVSTTTYTTDISNINNTISQKADKTTVDTLSGTVSDQGTLIQQNSDAIALKADQSMVDTLSQTVSSQGTQISQNATAIESKADQSTVDTLTGRVSTAESNISQQASEISARITTADADAKYATQTALTATANSLTSSITAVQTDLNNLQIGGRNLLRNTDFQNGLSSSPWLWDTWDFTGGATNGTKSIEQDSTVGKFFRVTTTVANANRYVYLDLMASGVSLRNSLFIIGQTYTVSLYIRTSVDTTQSQIYIQGVSTGQKFQTSAGVWKKVTHTFTLNNFNPNNRFTTGVQISDSLPAGTTIDIRQLKMEIGSKATDWSPAPEDMATSAQFTSLTQTLTGFQTTVQSEYAQKSMVTQTASSLQSSIDAKVDSNVYNSKISQLSNDINLRVSKNDVINQINVSTESILIAGNKVHITGQTTIDNAVIKDAMIQSVSADKISATTLSAISANLGNVTAGTITGVDITSSSLTVTSNVQDEYGNINTLTVSPSNAYPLQVTDSNGDVTAIGGGIINTDDIYIDGVIIGKNELLLYPSPTDMSPAYINFGSDYCHIRTSPAYDNASIDLDTDHVTTRGDLAVNGNISSSSGAVTASNMQLNGYHSLVMLDTQGLSVCGPAPSYTRVNVDAYSFTARNMQINGDHSLNSIDGGGLYASDGSGGTVDWTCKALHQSSQFELKQDFADVNQNESLARVLNTDVESYRFKSDVARGVNAPHIGAVIGGGYKLPSEYIDETGKAIVLSDMTADLLNAFKCMYSEYQDAVARIAQLETKVSQLEAA